MTATFDYLPMEEDPRGISDMIGRALFSAIDNDALCLRYQPLVDLQSGQVSGMEASMRWKHPEHGVLDEEHIGPLAQEYGLIDRLSAWTLRCACAEVRAWSEHDGTGVPVVVSMTHRQFHDPMLADTVGRTLSDAGIEPKLFCLRVPENILRQDRPDNDSILRRLHALGIRLELDHCVTGYVPLGILRRYPFSKVRIGRAFIDNVISDAGDGAIAKAIISMAHSLGIRVLVEGVRSEAQCDFLRQNMCDEIQGPIFSEALPPPQARNFLRERHCLPAHLLRQYKPARTLLLVDDEANIIAALKRLLRRDGYVILTANSGQDGLDILAKHDVDVIVSDQRMPGITGVEFLGKAKETHPDTVRIVLSGYSELQSVTDAVNEGAIYKFLMKPWDDTQLRGHIDEAFRRKEMADENRRLDLEVRTANFELAAANRQLEALLRQQQLQIKRDAVRLDVAREVLQHVPVPMLGLDEDGFIAFINGAAQAVFHEGATMLGCDAREAIPEVMNAVSTAPGGNLPCVVLNGTAYQVVSHLMGQESESRGKLITLSRQQGLT